jgi:hypothetical protein
VAPGGTEGRPQFGYSCEEFADGHLGIARGRSGRRGFAPDRLYLQSLRSGACSSPLLAVKDGMPSLRTIVHHQCLLQRASVAAIAVLRIRWCQLGYARSQLPFWFVDQPRESGPVT